MSKIFRNVRMVLNGCPVCKKNATFKMMIGTDETYRKLPSAYHPALERTLILNAISGHPENYLCGASGECGCPSSQYIEVWLIGPTGYKGIPLSKVNDFSFVRKTLKKEFEDFWTRTRGFF